MGNALPRSNIFHSFHPSICFITNSNIYRQILRVTQIYNSTTSFLYLFACRHQQLPKQTEERIRIFNT